MLRRGGILAYPTETVWGLGCDPAHLGAVWRLRALKQRQAHKGFILVAGSWRQFAGYFPNIGQDKVDKVCLRRTQPVSWVLADRDGSIPAAVKGGTQNVALRISAHPDVTRITGRLGRPILSTSANPPGMRSARTAADVDRYFGTRIDALVPGFCGSIPLPSQIRELDSDRILRK